MHVLSLTAAALFTLAGSCAATAPPPHVPPAQAPPQVAQDPLVPWLGRHSTKLSHSSDFGCSQSAANKTQSGSLTMDVWPGGKTLVQMRVRGEYASWSRRSGRSNTYRTTEPEVTCTWVGTASAVKDGLDVALSWRSTTAADGSATSTPSACTARSGPGKVWNLACQAEQRFTKDGAPTELTVCRSSERTPLLVGWLQDDRDTLPLSRDAVVAVHVWDSHGTLMSRDVTVLTR